MNQALYFLCGIRYRDETDYERWKHNYYLNIGAGYPCAGQSKEIEELLARLRGRALVGGIFGGVVDIGSIEEMSN